VLAILARVLIYYILLVDFFNKQLAENREITDAVWENLKKSWIAHGLKERQDEFTEKINTT
jgi:hypothetical protein